MKAVLVALLFAYLVFSVSGHEGHDHDHEEEPEEETDEDVKTDVVSLDGTSFDAFIKEHELTLVKFFAPWCGHCKALKPEYEQAATTLKGKSSLAEVDCTAEASKELCEKYEVKGFPTLKVFRNDGSEPQEFDQARKADAIVKFMIKANLPPFVELTTQAQLDEVTAKDLAVVAFFKAENTKEIEVFKAVSKSFRSEFDFAFTTNADLIPAGVTAPGLRMYRKFDEPIVTFNAAEITEEAVKAFVAANSFAMLGEIGPENYQKYVERGFPLVWVFYDKSDEKQQAVLDTARTVAKDFKGKLSFVRLDGIQWADHAKSMGLNGETPGIAIEVREKRRHYIYPQDKSVEVADLKAMCDGFLAGTLQPNLKSEPIPETNDGPVKVVVGKSFESIVMDKTKDVLIEFYAPWCGHCKELAPKYESLAKSFAKYPNIVIAKVDATANDTPVDIQGFPTLIFYPSDNKESPITYDQERSEAAIAKFIRANSPILKALKAEKKKKKDSEGEKPKDEL